MHEESGGRSQRESHDDKSEDEKRGLFAGFLRGTGDAEGIDEGIGEKVEEAHG